MCWQCDRPTSTYTDYLDHMRGLIAQHDWLVQGVEGGRLHAPWAYTAGLTSRDRPELVVTGLPLPQATDLLNDVADHILHAWAPRPGKQIPLLGGPLIEIVKVAVPTVHLHLAVDLFGRQISALQIVHADDQGLWPWDRGYRAWRGGQPVLGMRSLGSAAAPPTGSG